MTTRGRSGVDLRSPRPARPTGTGAWPRRLQILGLLVLAPVCAEYLSAYDDTTGDAARLIGGLVVFGPLYGAPALLIREVARRAGLGWPGIVMLATAFGLIEAGLVDQSLFSLDYRHIASWDDDLRGTFVGPLGLSAFNVLNFIGGHVIYSICAPIALVEGLRPSNHAEPWLTRRSGIAVALLYVAASLLVLVDSLTHESSHASPYQVVGSMLVVAALVVGAWALSRRRRLRPAPGARADDGAGIDPVDLSADDTIGRLTHHPVDGAPAGDGSGTSIGLGTGVRVRTVFVASLGVSVVYALAPPTWAGVVVASMVLVAAALLLRRAARSPGWGLRHVVAVATSAVLTRAVLSFTYYPVVGHVSALRKYGHSTVLLLLTGAICVLALRSSWRTPAAVVSGRVRTPGPSDRGRSEPR